MTARYVPSFPSRSSMEDVLDLIRARDLWERGIRGEGVTIAIIDTGISGERPEFAHRQAGGWAPEGEDPWRDTHGHGTMCACIAAGSKDSGGLFDGVAPGAQIYAGKTEFYEEELCAILDDLARRAREGERIVVSNSYGPPDIVPPEDPGDSEHFEQALDRVIQAGALVCFSSGDVHLKAGGNRLEPSPNTIWKHKSRSDLLTVGASDLEGRVWGYSSRGPGQRFGRENTNAKPDLTGVAPAWVDYLRGNRVSMHRQGWATSGACPQVAGLLALLWSAWPDASREELFQACRAGAVDLGDHPYAQGTGRLDCVNSWRWLTERKS